MQPDQRYNILSIECEESERYLRYKYLHDLGHVIGMAHEHQRFDRDFYISVDYEHIYPGT